MDFYIEFSDGDIDLRIMQKSDFKALFEIAKDPAIWDQHDDPTRCTLYGFKKYFYGGISNPENCYLIFYKNELVGSTRYYEYNAKDSSLKIGYTFYAKKCWGTPLNRRVKKIMLDYIFNFVESVFFDVWYENARSQKAVEKLGAKFFKHDKTRDRCVFRLKKVEWNE